MQAVWVSYFIYSNIYFRAAKYFLISYPIFLCQEIVFILIKIPKYPKAHFVPQRIELSASQDAYLRTEIYRANAQDTPILPLSVQNLYEIFDFRIYKRFLAPLGQGFLILDSKALPSSWVEAATMEYLPKKSYLSLSRGLPLQLLKKPPASFMSR